MKLLLVHAPRPYWPFLHEQDNYLVPQSLVCLAGATRAAGIETRILDCMPLKMGFRSLSRAITDFRPDVVGVGENHAMFAAQARRVCAVAKQAWPRARTVLGGAHFTNTIDETLRDANVDFIVLGEGERTLVNLLRELQQDHPAYTRVRGLAFHARQLGDDPASARVVLTEPEPLVEDLDSLPEPAYDLLPMHLYGRSKYLFSPGGTTIAHGRGCSGRCSFCAFWIQMAERKLVDGKFVLQARWRTKSPGRTVDEVQRLLRDYGKQSLVFVDDSFNLDQKWNDAFADEMLRRRLRTNWFGFMRADCLVRDEKAGVLDKMVRAGLRHVCIGIERADDTELAGFNKRFYSTATTREAFATLRRRYPQVFRQGTFIVGVRAETRESLRAVTALAQSLGLDFPAFHPLTPVPGTALYEEALREGWLETHDFSQFDWSTPVMPSRYLSRDEIEVAMDDATRACMSLPWLLRGLLQRHGYSRRMYIWWVYVAIKVAMTSLWQRLNPLSPRTYHRLITPLWYES